MRIRGAQYTCSLDSLSNAFFQVVYLKFYFPFIIYIFLKVEETITFAKLMESTGIVALGVHGR